MGSIDDRQIGPNPEHDREDEPRVFTVSQVVTAADRALRAATGPIWVRGEVTDWKVWGSGVRYFSVRDAGASLSCVMFADAARHLPIDPVNGDEVAVYGQVGIYRQRGQFQLTVSRLEGTGVGGLWARAMEELRQRLAREGLLDDARKRPLPALPERIGIVTSQQGAALQDMLRVLRRRAWWVRVVISPCTVEGAGAGPDVARALARFRPGDAEVDVVLLARGGGSPESLWGFNSEPLARAIAACPYPVVSAVGHETDHTIADAVADRRASTPTAGAELVSPDGEEVRAWVEAYPALLRAPVLRTAGQVADATARARTDLARAIAGRLRMETARLSAAQMAIESRSPRRRLLALLEELERLRMDMRSAGARALQRGRDRLAAAAAGLEARSPLAVLARGYALITTEDGRAVRSAEEVSVGQRLTGRLARGSLGLVVETLSEEGVEP